MEDITYLYNVLYLKPTSVYYKSLHKNQKLAIAKPCANYLFGKRKWELTLSRAKSFSNTKTVKMLKVPQNLSCSLPEEAHTSQQIILKNHEPKPSNRISITNTYYITPFFFFFHLIDCTNAFLLHNLPCQFTQGHCAAIFMMAGSQNLIVKTNPSA